MLFSGSELRTTSLLLANRFFYMVHGDVTVYKTCAESGIGPLVVSLFSPLALFLDGCMSNSIMQGYCYSRVQSKARHLGCIKDYSRMRMSHADTTMPFLTIPTSPASRQASPMEISGPTHWRASRKASHLRPCSSQPRTRLTAGH